MVYKKLKKATCMKIVKTSCKTGFLNPNLRMRTRESTEHPHTAGGSGHKTCRIINHSNKIDINCCTCNVYVAMYIVMLMCLSSGEGAERILSKPQLKNLMDALYHKVANKWKMIV